MTKSKIQKFIKKINNVFIKIILFIFYLLIIGFGTLIYRLFKKNKTKTNSYWQDFSSKFDLDFT